MQKANFASRKEKLTYFADALEKISLLQTDKECAHALKKVSKFLDNLMISSSSSSESSSSSFKSRFHHNTEKPQIAIDPAEQEKTSKPVLTTFKLKVHAREGGTPPPKVDYTKKILIRRRQRSQISAQDPHEVQDLNKQYEMLSPSLRVHNN